MQFQLAEDVRGFRNWICAFSTGFIVLFIAGCTILLHKGAPLTPALLFGGAGSSIIIYSIILYKRSGRTRWSLTPDGLNRALDEVEELIQWDAIRFIKRDKHGVLIHWVRSGKLIPSFSEHEVRLIGSSTDLMTAFGELTKNAKSWDQNSSPAIVGKQLLRLAGLALIFCGAVFICMTASISIERWRSNQWPTVTGRVIDVASQKARRKYDVIESRIAYEYFVNNLRFDSDRYSMWSKGFLEEISISEQNPTSKKYHVGDHVLVHYNPSQPNQAVLVPGADWTFAWFQLAFEIILLGFGIKLWKGASSRTMGSQ